MKIFSKLTLAVIAFVGMTQVISAQTVGKGAWMMGGSAGFTHFGYKDTDKTTVLSLDPSLGYFFADDLALGLNVSYYESKTGGASANSQTGLGPFLRFYIADPIFVQVRLDLGLDKGSGTFYGAEVGYSLFLNNNVAVEPAVFYDISNPSGVSSDHSEFGASIGIQVFCNHNHGMKN